MTSTVGGADAAASPRSAAAAATYRIVLPPGWVRLPVRDGAERAVDALLDDRFAGLPMDTFGPIRKELRRRLLTQLTVARDHEAVDLYLPVTERNGTVIPASFVVALLPFDTVETPPPEQVLMAYAAGTPDARVLQLDGAPAVRSRRVEPARPNREDDPGAPTVRVDYVVAVPETTDVWLTFSFSTIGDGDPDSRFSTVLVDLFDAIMGTLAWTGPLQVDGDRS